MPPTLSRASSPRGVRSAVGATAQVQMFTLQVGRSFPAAHGGQKPRDGRGAVFVTRVRRMAHGAFGFLKCLMHERRKTPVGAERLPGVTSSLSNPPCKISRARTCAPKTLFRQACSETASCQPTVCHLCFVLVPVRTGTKNKFLRDRTIGHYFEGPAEPPSRTTCFMR